MSFIMILQTIVKYILRLQTFVKHALSRSLDQ